MLSLICARIVIFLTQPKQLIISPHLFDPITLFIRGDTAWKAQCYFQLSPGGIPPPRIPNSPPPEKRPKYKKH